MSQTRVPHCAWVDIGVMGRASVVLLSKVTAEMKVRTEVVAWRYILTEVVRSVIHGSR